MSGGETEGARPAAAARVGAGAAALLLGLHLLGAALFLLDRTPGTDAAWTGFPLDDSWIHLVYARSLARLEGFDYNPGQPEAGFTSPLWTLLLVPVFWLKPLWGGSAVLGAKALALGLAWACSLVAARLAMDLTGSRAAGLLAGALIAVDPTFRFAALSGMEVVLAALTPLLALWLLCRERMALAGIALAAAPLARPENALLLCVAAPACAALLIERRAPPRRWLAVALPTLLAGGAWVAHSIYVTGRPLPATFYAKGQSGWVGAEIARNAAVIAGLLASQPLARLGAGAIALGVGAWQLWRTARGAPEPRRRAAALVTLLHPAVFLAGIAVTHRLMSPDYFYWARYAVPALPFLLLLVAIGAAALAALAGGARPAAARALGVLGLAALLPAAIELPRASRALSTTFAWNSQNMNEVQVEIGRWLREHTPPDSVVATVDAGAIRYHGARTTVDLLGLNSHVLLGGDREAALRRLAPGFVVGLPGVYPRGDWLAEWGARERFAARSQHYTVSPEPRQAAMVVYEVTAPRP